MKVSDKTQYPIARAYAIVSNFLTKSLRVNSLLLLWVVLLVACHPTPDSDVAEASSDTRTILKISQEVPNIIHIDLDREGPSHGDLLAFDAEVLTDSNVKGTLSGYLLTIFIPEEDHEDFQERMVQMVFDLGDGNTILVGGRSLYPDMEEAEMQENVPQVRAIIGGTGTYIGARGQITTTRMSDGSYEHVLELLD